MHTAPHCGAVLSFDLSYTLLCSSYLWSIVHIVIQFSFLVFTCCVLEMAVGLCSIFCLFFFLFFFSFFLSYSFMLCKTAPILIFSDRSSIDQKILSYYSVKSGRRHLTRERHDVLCLHCDVTRTPGNQSIGRRANATVNLQSTFGTVHGSG